MKKQVMITLLLGLLLGSTQLSAQDMDSVITLPTVIVSSGTTVSAEVDKAFKKTFPDAENLRWYTLDKNYLAKFIENDLNHQALLSKKGRLKYDITYGGESQLPQDIRQKVSDSYNDYKITSVANVKESGRSIWVINLESLKNLVVARAEDDVFEEVAKVSRAN
ncbi:MAG TPA: hypothetical protein VJ279_06720 [Hanamia sp.]|jgi:hypothetical protein|nr:hypothetical protein [Hanamia sp.]